MKVKILNINDLDYPQMLKELSSPPQRLYAIGNTSLLNEKCISIIGSRVCTEKGAKISKEFAKELSQYGLCITSGMAKGIDTFAHIGALEASGKTIAVLGGGFKHIYPKENIELFNKITENGGLVITEYEENVEVSSKQFVQRNLIVSGLSIGVLVVEAKYRSGTSITAQMAIKQGKKVFCIAHDIEDASGIGTNRLLKNGAILVTEVNDIINEFRDLKFKQNKVEKELIVKKINKDYMPIYSLLSNSEININEICKKSKMNISKVNYILTMLQINGDAKQLPGNNFVKGE